MKARRREIRTRELDMMSALMSRIARQGAGEGEFAPRSLDSRQPGRCLLGHPSGDSQLR